MESYLPELKGMVKGIRHGRNVYEGYQRGWGLQFGGLKEMVLIDSLYKEGGQSLVYIAFHCKLNQKVIIKQTEVNNEFSEAIEEEGRLLSSLDHSSLPRITNLFIENQMVFLVMIC